MNRRLIGVVGVDSGQIMVADPCYIEASFPTDELTNVKFDEAKSHYVNLDGSEIRNEQLSLTYDGARLASMSDRFQLYYTLGHAGAAVCVDSGYGDGSYPVYGEFNDEGRCMRLIVEFGEYAEEAEA